MVKFSVSTEGSSKTISRSGGEAFAMNPTEQLVQIVTTNLLGEPKFYGDVQKQMDEAIEKVALKNPEFILKLAAYCRNEMYLRTVSVYLLVKAANLNPCKKFVRKYTPKILRRADELYEALACQLDLFKKPIPNSLKKGLKETFTNFDEYQFGKYNRQTGVKFKDVVMLSHPKQPAELIKKILDGKLETPYTWETELSLKGNKKEVWEALIDSRKVNFMAQLRNVNNVFNAGISKEHWKKVLDFLSNEKAVVNSKQFPFRFYSALKNTQVDEPFANKELQQALGQALEYSTQNLPKLKGRTFVACDSSGSMSSPMSKKGSMQFVEVGCLMGAMTNKFSDTAIIGLFDSQLRIVPNLSGNFLNDTQALVNLCHGGATYGYLVFEYLNQQNIDVDRLIFFTDMEMYGASDWSTKSVNQEMDAYLKTHPETKVYFVNLNSYGEVAVNLNQRNVVSVSGWSEKILSFISMFEESKQTFTEKINQYQPPAIKVKQEEVDA